MTDPLELAYVILVDTSDRIRKLEQRAINDIQRKEIEVLLDKLEHLQSEIHEVIMP